MKRIQSSFLYAIDQLRNSKFAVLFLCSVIFIFCMFLYIDTSSYKLSGNDDDTFSKLSFEQHSLKEVFTENVFFNDKIKTYYRPVLTLSFMIDNYFLQSPTILHFVNVLLHSFCCILVFIFFKRYFFDTSLSFFVAILFAAHPINVFTVAWIPGRNDSLLCLFFLLSLTFFMEYLKNDRKIFLVLNLLSLAVAIFTKENSAIIPIICLYMWFVNGKKINRKFFIIFLSQFAIISAFLVIYSHFVEVTNFSERINSLIVNFKMLFDYYSSAYLFNIHFSKYLSDRNVILGIVSFVISIFFAGWCGLKTKDKIFYFILPVLMILPTLVIGQMFFQGNRLYIPLIFMLIPFVSLLQKYFDRKFIYFLFILLIVISSFLTLKYQTVFRNELTYLGTIDKEKPNAEIYIANIYSYNLLKYAKLEEAAAKAREIAQITKYRNPYNLYVLSIVNMHEGNFEQAIMFLEQILNFDDDVYTKLTVCYDKIGDAEKSKYYYNIVLRLNNNDVEKTNELIERENQCLEKKLKYSY